MGVPGSLLRYAPYAISAVAKDPEQGPQAARLYLRQELPHYWSARAAIIELLLLGAVLDGAKEE